MDTPYRLKNLIEAIYLIEKTNSAKRQYFLAMELGKPNESYLRGSIKELHNAVKGLEKPEFILVLDRICP